jgi:hypothetical protein
MPAYDEEKHPDLFKCDWAIGSIFFWVFTIVSLGLPFLNDLLIKLTNKNYSEKLLWEK